MKRPYLILGFTLWTLAFLFAFLPSWPHIYYRLSPHTPESLAQTLGSTPRVEPISISKTRQYLPPIDPSLPKESGLIISSIGVRGEIHEGSNWQEILKQGVWRVPEFGTPEDQQPVILAAHRWGYLNWTNQFRYLNSFYNLPKLKIGEEIKINYNQRQYTYKVYAQEVAEQITDYSADLILYTCQLWNSPLRIIKYANHVN